MMNGAIIFNENNISQRLNSNGAETMMVFIQLEFFTFFAHMLTGLVLSSVFPKPTYVHTHDEGTLCV
jgi:hypothetical protein